MKNGIDANIQSMTQAEKAMLRYQYVMAQSEHITGDFARTSMIYHNVLTRLKANFMTLKGTIGTSLMNLFKPVLVVVNNAIVVINKFAKAIGDSLGKILGWRYEVGSGALAMEDAAYYADDVAGGLGNAGKAAKELKKQLQGFDELNNLSLDDDNGGGGSGGGGSSGLGAGGASDLAGQWVKDEGLFESDWDTWFKLGRGISEAWTEGLNSIDWDEVYSAFDNFGKGLADFLNGLITPDLFGAVGRTISGSLNSAFHFLNSFGTTFDWLNFGNSIATGINNFFSTFDFKLAGKAMSVWIKGGLDALIEFIDKTDFEKIGQGIGDFLSELDIPDIVGKLGTLAVKIIEALGEAIIGLGESNPLAAAIVGLIAITKLVGLGTSIATALGTATAGKTFSMAQGKTIGIALTVGSVFMFDQSGNELTAESLTQKGLSAAGLFAGGKMMGLSTSTSLKITLATLEFNLVQGATQKFASWVAQQFGDVNLSGYYKDFHWFGEDGFFDTIMQDPGDLPQAWYDMWTDYWDWVAESYGSLADDIKDALPDWLKKMLGIEELPTYTAESGTEYSYSSGKFGDPLSNKTEDFFQNASIKLGIEYPEESEVQSGWDKFKNIWKDTDAKFEVDSEATPTSQVESDHTERKGFWGNLKALFGVDSNVTSTREISSNYGERSSNWKNKMSLFKVDSTATSKQEVANSYAVRAGAWNNLSRWFKIDAHATDRSDVKSSYQARSAYWNNLSRWFKIDAHATEKVDVKSAYQARSAYWVNDTASFKVDPTVTAKSTIQSDYNKYSAIWQDKKANYSVAVDTVASDSSKAQMNAVIASMEAKLRKNAFFKNLTLPRFAKGMVADKATIGLFGEAGTEAVVPLERNTQWLGKMAGMLAEEMAYKEYRPASYGSATYQGSTSYNAPSSERTANDMAIQEQNALLREEIQLLRQIANKDVSISSRDVFSAVVDENNSYVDRTGNSPFFV